MSCEEWNTLQVCGAECYWRCSSECRNSRRFIFSRRPIHRVYSFMAPWRSGPEKSDVTELTLRSHVPDLPVAPWGKFCFLVLGLRCVDCGQAVIKLHVLRNSFMAMRASTQMHFVISSPRLRAVIYLSVHRDIKLFKVITDCFKWLKTVYSDNKLFTVIKNTSNTVFSFFFISMCPKTITFTSKTLKLLSKFRSKSSRGPIWRFDSHLTSLGIHKQLYHVALRKYWFRRSCLVGIP